MRRLQQGSHQEDCLLGLQGLARQKLRQKWTQMRNLQESLQTIRQVHQRTSAILQMGQIQLQSR